MVVKILVPFWIPIILRPKRDHNFDNHPNDKSMAAMVFAVLVRLPLFYHVIAFEVRGIQPWDSGRRHGPPLEEAKKRLSHAVTHVVRVCHSQTLAHACWNKEAGPGQGRLEGSFFEGRLSVSEQAREMDREGEREREGEMCVCVCVARNARGVKTKFDLEPDSVRHADHKLSRFSCNLRMLEE